MKRLITSAMACALSAGTAFAADALDTAPAGGVAWSVDFGLLLLHRQGAGAVPLFTDSFGGGNTLVSADDVDPGFGAGFEAALRAQNGRHGFEFGGIFVPSWYAESGWTYAPMGAVVPYATPIGNVFFPSDLFASYDSSLTSLEANYRWSANDRIDLIAGLRYVSVDEALLLDQDIGPGANYVLYDIAASNRAVGGQIGVGFNIPVASVPGLTFNGAAKLAYLANSRVNLTDISQDLGPAFHAESADSVGSVLLDLDANLTWAVNDRVSVSAGYRALWMNNLALAPNQIAVLDPAIGAGSVASSSALTHGLTVKFSAKF